MEATLDTAAALPSTRPAPGAISRSRLWTSRVMTGLPMLFLAWDAAMKIIPVPFVIEASEKVGLHRETLPFIGASLLLGVLLLGFRKTAPFGAVLVSAYLGGAVAMHVRLGDPLFSHTLFPVYFALLIWGGLSLRDPRVAALSPFAR